MDFLDDEVYVKYLWNHSQHIDDEIVEENQILNYLEEIIEEIILGTLHRDMVVMLGPQSIISHYEPCVFLRKGSLSNKTVYDSSI